MAARLASGSWTAAVVVGMQGRAFKLAQLLMSVPVPVGTMTLLLDHAISKGLQNALPERPPAAAAAEPKAWVDKLAMLPLVRAYWKWKLYKWHRAALAQDAGPAALAAAAEELACDLTAMIVSALRPPAIVYPSTRPNTVMTSMVVTIHHLGANVSCRGVAVGHVRTKAGCCFWTRSAGRG